METQPFGNSELDAEYLASQIIRGTIFPESYIMARAIFCDMPIIEFVPEIAKIQMGIQKQLIHPFGTIQDKSLEKFLSGENTEVLSALKMVKEKADALASVYQQALIEAFLEAFHELEINMSGQDFRGMGEAIGIASQHKAEEDRIRQSETYLRKASGSCEQLINLFGTLKVKLSKKNLRVGDNTDYKLYINSLTFNPQVFTGSIVLGVVMGNVLDTLKSALPKGNVLNPYKLDETNCLLEALCYPKDFYSMCENDKIVNTIIGEKFGKCYPEYWKKFIDLYLKKYEDMDYEKQLIFRKCFGLRENNSQLIQFVTGALSMVV